MTDTEESLEIRGGEKVPDMGMIVDELQLAAADMTTYLSRVAASKRWWQCEWFNQWDDGKCHPIVDGGECWPWNGGSDSRLHIVKTIVQEHTRLDLVAFWSAKVQVKSIRPFAHGREVNVAQRMLDWRMTQMKRELITELELAYNWKHAYGLSFIGVEWEQQRDITYVSVTLQDVSQVAMRLGLGDFAGMLADPDKHYDKDLVDVLQGISPVLPRDEARTMLNELRATGQSAMPVTGFRVNKPKWTALRPAADVIFPSETSDIQQARWVCTRELVSETELTDRVVTDGYDEQFVEEALDHKGIFANFVTPDTIEEASLGSNRNLIELHHFLMRYLHNGVPCMYKTTFNHASIGDKGLYAKHAKFEYDHQQYPVVALRRTNHFRPLLTSMGIAEESYTDEMDIKRQQDGLNNRTDLIHKPPMIVPTLRAQAIKNSYGPNAVMTASRPNEVAWAPLPPIDQTPGLVMQMVQLRLDRRYPITGGAVDPEIKAVCRQQLAIKNLGEMELALEQTFQLQQQYETDADVQDVAGGQQPWNFSVRDIQGQHNTSATVDMKMIDMDYAEIKLDMLGKMMPFRQGGGKVFNAAAQLVDPDLADELTEDQMSPTAMEREKSDEYNAVAQIMSGIEPQKPLMANPQFRLQTIQEIMMQPQVSAKLGQDQIGQKLLKNRVDFFKNQIQQFQINPQIGRAVSAPTFGGGAPAVTNQPAS